MKNFFRDIREYFDLRINPARNAGLTLIRLIIGLIVFACFLHWIT